MSNATRRASKANGAQGASIARSSKLLFAQSGGRPTAGKMLYSYTRAWLTLEGLQHGGDISRSRFIAIAGSKALSHHLNETGAFEVNESGRIQVSARGQFHFSDENANRPVIESVVLAYQAFMMSGKIDGSLIRFAAQARRVDEE